MLLWFVKQEPKKAGIGKWFCIVGKREGDGKSTDRNISLRKIILAKKQFNTLMETNKLRLKTNGLMTPTQISTIRMSKELLMQKII
jgi:hypothetical protein